MEKSELPREPFFLLRLLSFFLGLVLFVSGIAIGVFGLVLWKWLRLPKFTFTFCSIPILLGIFFFGYTFYGNQDAVAFAQRPKKSPYSRHGKQEDVQIRHRSDGSRISIVPVRGGREVSGECIGGYYTEHSGSSDL